MDRKPISWLRHRSGVSVQPEPDGGNQLARRLDDIHTSSWNVQHQITLVQQALAFLIVPVCSGLKKLQGGFKKSRL